MKIIIGLVLMLLGGLIAIVGIIIGSLISIRYSKDGPTRITLLLVIITGSIGIALMILGVVLVRFIN